jgi:phenylacetate-CoA ligase
MSDAYGLLFQRLLYPSWESGIRQRPTLQYLRRLERTQWCTLDELLALQQVELKKLLTHAWHNVPDYRARLSNVGMQPDDVRSLEDLRRVPLLTREDAALGFEARKSTEPPLPKIDKSTSGTSGNPLTFAYDWDSEHWRQAVKLRGYAWAGYQPGDRSLHYWGAPAQRRPLGKRLKVALDHAVRREHYADCADRSEAALAQIVQLIRVKKPSVIVCYAQAGAALARHINETGSRTWPDISVIAAAERLFPSDRSTLMEAFGPGIFETYGSREVMLIAAECEAHQGLHVSMENLIVEVIVRDAQGERPAAPGELGEVAVTDLHNYGAPFVRYLTGDLAVAREPKRCACGRHLTMLDHVEGRTTDTLRDGAGRPVNGLLFNIFFVPLAHKVKEFQVVQRRDGAIDLRIVPAAAFDDSVIESLRKHCARFIPGVELRTEIVAQLTVEPGGKLRVVSVES